MKLIEFLGMPRAGKTTQIDRLKFYLESKGFRVALLTDRERAQSLKTPPSEGLAYTLAFFTASVEAYYEHLHKADYLLIDRGFNDVAVWSDVRFALGEISQEERDALKTIFDRFKKLVNKTFYFKVPSEIGLARHEKGEDQAVDRVAMNKKWLDVLQDSYDKNFYAFENVIMIAATEDAAVIERQIVRAIR